MARLKIGDGIQFEAQLPKIEQSEPNIEPSKFDVLAYIQEEMSKYQPKEDVVIHRKDADLSIYVNRDELKEVYHYMDNIDDCLSNKIEELSNRKIELPEVKHITHIKDVSLEAIKECDKMIKFSEVSLMLKVSDLQKKNRTQKVINLVLGCAILLTIFLHLK